MIYVCSKYDFHASYVFCFCVQYYIIEQFHLNGKIIHNEMKANFDFLKDLANDSAICIVLASGDSIKLYYFIVFAFSFCHNRLCHLWLCEFHNQKVCHKVKWTFLCAVKNICLHSSSGILQLLPTHTLSHLSSAITSESLLQTIHTSTNTFTWFKLCKWQRWPLLFGHAWCGSLLNMHNIWVKWVMRVSGATKTIRYT